VAPGGADGQARRSARSNDAGVLIEIVKVDGIFGYSDAAADYAFTLAKALGARAISTEIAEDGQAARTFADKRDDGRLPITGDRAGGCGSCSLMRRRREPGHWPLVAGNHGSPVRS
jgi:hypothetical protein